MLRSSLIGLRKTAKEKMAVASTAKLVRNNEPTIHQP